MGFNFIPASHGQLRSEDVADTSAQQTEIFQSDIDDPLFDRRWPAGWWILPFAIGGMIEWIIGIDWLLANF